MMQKPHILFTKYQQSLIPACLLFIAGVLVASGSLIFYSNYMFWILWLIIAITGLLINLLHSSYYSCTKWFLWLASFFAGGLFWMQFHFEPGPNDISQWADYKQAEVRGIVAEQGIKSGQWVVKANQLGPHTVEGQILLKPFKSNSFKNNLQVGQKVYLKGELIRPESARFPGDFDYQAYLLKHKITAILYTRQVVIEQQHSSSHWLNILRLAAYTRDRLANSFNTYLSPNSADILTSIVLGEHAKGMDPEIKTEFIRSGLIHLLSASGLNVGLIGFFFMFFGKLFKLPLKIRLFMAMAGVAFYCIMTGLPPSVQRAGIMLELAFALKVINKELTPLCLLCLAGVALVFINPQVVTMLGFQLSFMTTLGLIVMVKPLQEKLGFYITNRLAGILLVPVIAQLWATPLLLFNFHEIQLMSLPANLLALPMAVILTYAGFILGGLSLAMPYLTGWLIGWTDIVCTALLKVAGFFSGLSFAVWKIPSPPLPSIILLIGILMFLAYWLNYPLHMRPNTVVKVVVTGFLLILIPVSIAKIQKHNYINLAWLPYINKGGIQIIQLPSSESVIVNAPDASNYVAKNLHNYFRKEGIGNIALLNITSPYATNFEGLPDILNSFATKNITSPKLLSVKAAKNLANYAIQSKTPFQTLEPTNIVYGKKQRAVIFSAMPDEIIQRIEVGSSCMAFHWGNNRIEESHLKNITNGCMIIQDQKEQSKSTTILIANQAPIVLEKFFNLQIMPDQLRLQNFN